MIVTGMTKEREKSTRDVTGASRSDADTLIISAGITENLPRPRDSYKELCLVLFRGEERGKIITEGKITGYLMKPSRNSLSIPWALTSASFVGSLSKFQKISCYTFAGVSVDCKVRLDLYLCGSREARNEIFLLPYYQ